jgi:hypothetical protein
MGGEIITNNPVHLDTVSDYLSHYRLPAFKEYHKYKLEKIIEVF